MSFARIPPIMVLVALEILDAVPTRGSLIGYSHSQKKNCHCGIGAIGAAFLGDPSAGLAGDIGTEDYIGGFIRGFDNSARVSDTKLNIYGYEDGKAAAEACEAVYGAF